MKENGRMFNEDEIVEIVMGKNYYPKLSGMSRKELWSHLRNVKVAAAGIGDTGIIRDSSIFEITDILRNNGEVSDELLLRAAMEIYALKRNIPKEDNL